MNIPINIAFKLPSATLKKVHYVHEKIDLSIEGQHYFLQGIPHLTLWMGFVNSNELKNIKKSLNPLIQNINLSALNPSLTLYKNSILSVSVKKTNRLATFQSKIHFIMEKYRSNEINVNHLNSTTMDYLASVQRKDPAFFDPHITIGFGTKIPLVKFNKFYLSQIEMFEVRNNGTCIALV